MYSAIHSVRFFAQAYRWFDGLTANGGGLPFVLDLSKGGRSLLRGRGAPLETLETEGQMLQRVMPELMGMKKVLVLNDEAHHCYREKPDAEEEEELKGDDREEAEKNKEAARM